MAQQISIFHRKTYGYQQAAFGTAQTKLVEPLVGAYTTLFDLRVGSSATLQSVYVMRELGRTTFTADAAASQAVVNVAADPGVYSTGYTGTNRTFFGNGAAPRTADNPAAANDFVVYQCPDGTYVLDTIASVASLAWTLTTNLPTGGVKAGGTLWWFGIQTDTSPYDALPHLLLKPTVSTETRYGLDTIAGGGGFVRSPVKNSPLVLYLNNITADTNSFNFVDAGHTNR